jgi:DNA-binding LacI/PurR family transcriptional regulator
MRLCRRFRCSSSQKTRARVLERVKELNYHPNLMARGLVTGRSYLLGLIPTSAKPSLQPQNPF